MGYLLPAMKAKHTNRENKTAIVRVRMRDTSKHRLQTAARALETDQSKLIRLAIREYLQHHLPDAA